MSRGRFGVGGEPQRSREADILAVAIEALRTCEDERRYELLEGHECDLQRQSCCQVPAVSLVPKATRETRRFRPRGSESLSSRQ